MKRPPAEARRPLATRARGFTLIEVLAALVIVALGMLGAIEAVTQQARNGVYLRDKTMAHWIAMNKITEQRLQAAPPPVAESSDNLEFAGRRWHWTMRVTQTQVQSMRRMDVSVRPADSPDEVALATVSGFYGSAVAPSGSSMVSWNASPDGAPSDEDESGTEREEKKKKKKRPVRPPGEVNPPPPPEED